MAGELQKNTDEILREIESNNSFALCSHVRPDGDAVGSLLGLGLSLESMGKSVVYLNENGVPGSLKFLKSAEKIQQPSEQLDVDVVIALDTATKPRLGQNCLKVLPNDVTWINIDHHISNPKYGDLNLIDSESPATGQIIYDILEHGGIVMPEAAFEAIYVAISTDTGSFQYRNVTARTLNIVAEIIAKGIDTAKLAELTYHNFPLARVLLLKELLNVLELHADNRIACWHITPEMLANANAKSEDTEDLIDVIRAVDSVEVAIFFDVIDDQTVRISSRSKTPKVNLSEICGMYNGGGHAAAAGATAKGSLDSVKREFIKTVCESLDKK